MSHLYIYQLPLKFDCFVKFAGVSVKFLVFVQSLIMLQYPLLIFYPKQMPEAVSITLNICSFYLITQYFINNFCQQKHLSAASSSDKVSAAKVLFTTCSILLIAKQLVKNTSSIICRSIT